MEHLWAPWRMEFIERPKEMSECIFCAFPPKNDDPTHRIAHRGSCAFVMLNNYPYNNGHLLIAAYRHGGELASLSVQEHLDLMHLTDLSCRALEDAYHPDGFNIGMNIGAVAGAGIPGHLHIHVVPRWKGDSNFMPVLADTRVLPEALDASYLRIRDSFEKLKTQQTE